MLLTFDIGGTSARGSLITDDARRIVRSLRSDTPNFLRYGGATAHALLDRLRDTLKLMSEHLLAGEQPRAVSLAVPGPVTATGDITALPTILGRSLDAPLPSAAFFRPVWPSTPLYVLNDLTAAGYRYVAEGTRDFCIIAVGSGIGAKIFVEGRPLLGPAGCGGEIGHLSVEAESDALRCDCGSTGHLGAGSSGRGTLRRAQQMAAQDRSAFLASLLGQQTRGDIAALSTELLVRGVLAADSWSMDVLRAAQMPLARVMAAIHAATAIDQFILVGGFALAMGELYRSALATAAAAYACAARGSWNDMVRLGHGDDNHGVIGAAVFAQRGAAAPVGRLQLEPATNGHAL